jgi:hypothetical protein
VSQVKYKAKIVHLVTDAPDIPHRLISAKHTYDRAISLLNALLPFRFKNH